MFCPEKSFLNPSAAPRHPENLLQRALRTLSRFGRPAIESAGVFPLTDVLLCWQRPPFPNRPALGHPDFLTADTLPHVALLTTVRSRRPLLTELLSTVLM